MALVWALAGRVSGPCVVLASRAVPGTLAIEELAQEAITILSKYTAEDSPDRLSNEEKSVIGKIVQ